MSKEKILTQKCVYKFGLDKVPVITVDMLKEYTSIGDNAFYGCNGLTSVTIPNSVTSIGKMAFYGCTGLTSIMIPNSVSSIGNYAFYGTGLTSLVYNAHVFAFMPPSYSGAYTIPDGIEIISSTAFYSCSNLTSVTIPNSVTSIGNYAFEYCIGLTSITIPNRLKNIGEGAFAGCSGLTSVVIGDKTHKRQIVTNGKCKAYKAFNANMTCRRFQYEEGKAYEINGEPKLCNRGFHACLKLADVFIYYYGKLGKDIVIHEVELDGVSDERRFDSKVVAKKITIGKRIL